MYNSSAPFEPEVRNRTRGNGMRTSGSGHSIHKNSARYFAAVSVRATDRAAEVPAVRPNTAPDIRPVPPG